MFTGADAEFGGPGKSLTLLLMISLLSIPFPAVSDECHFGTSVRAVNDEIPGSNGPGSVWNITADELFEGGIFEGTCTLNGSLSLELHEGNITDDLCDLSMVSSLEYLEHDPVKGELRLVPASSELLNDIHDQLLCIACTDDGGAIAGGYMDRTFMGKKYRDGLVVRTDRYGNIIWNITYGTDYYMSTGFQGITWNGSDRYVLTGSAINPEHGQYDIWCSEIDTEGFQENERFYDIGYNETPYCIISTTDDGFVMAGSYYLKMVETAFVVKVARNGTVEWNVTYENMDRRVEEMTELPDGSFLGVGREQMWGIDREFAVWTFKLDKYGYKEWSRTVRKGEAKGSDIVQTPDGGFAVVGSVFDGLGSDWNVWLIKFDPDGKEQWNTTFGGPRNDMGYGILSLGDGRLVLCGETEKNPLSDAWILATDHEGNMLWNITKGDSRIDAAYDICTLRDGKMGVCGAVRNNDGYDNSYLFLICQDGTGPEGVMISEAFVTGGKESDLNEFVCNVVIPAGSVVIAEFSHDGITWCNAYGVLGEVEGLADGMNVLKLGEWAPYGGPLQYRMRFKAGPYGSPALRMVSVRYSWFQKDGQFISPVLGEEVFTEWGAISWTFEEPYGCGIELRLRTFNDPSGIYDAPFLGPDGTGSTYFENGSDIPPLFDLDGFVQFKISLSSTNDHSSPFIRPPSIYRNRAPSVLEIGSDPTSGSSLTIFNLTFNAMDHDGDIPLRAFVDMVWDPGNVPESALLDLPHIEIEMQEVDPDDIITSDGKEYFILMERSVPGSYRIKGHVNDGELEGVSEVLEIQVVAGPLHHIIVSPSNMTMRAGESYKFTASGYDELGNLREINPSWDVDGGGYISQDGVFSPSWSGEWTISASDSDIEGTSLVHVHPADLENIKVHPMSATITADEQIDFTTACYDRFGNLVDIAPDWSVSGGGTIDENGTYSADIVGTWTVTASFENVTDSAEIIVKPGLPFEVRISPGQTVVNVSQSVLFTAMVLDLDKNRIETSVIWDVDGGGYIEDNGSFTALTPGNWTVSAMAGSISSEAFVIVIEGLDIGEGPERGGSMLFAIIAGIVILLIVLMTAIAFFFLLMKKRKCVLAEEPSSEPDGNGPTEPSPVPVDQSRPNVLGPKVQ